MNEDTASLLRKKREQVRIKRERKKMLKCKRLQSALEYNKK